MMYARVEKSKAESVRRMLLKSNALDGSRRVEHSGDYVLFPVNEGSWPVGFDLVEYEGRISRHRPKCIKEALEGKLKEGELSKLPSSYSVVGDIAVMQLPDDLLTKGDVIGQALISTFPNIKVVCLKTHEVSGEYRIPKVEVVAGENRTETVHREHGLYYKIDVAKAYFSPRLASERKRVADQIREGERVLVLFAGVGPYAILAAKQSKAKVTAVELNQEAVEYMRWNVLRNKADVEVLAGDARQLTPRLGSFDRIIMPLPKQADLFLDVAVDALSDDGVIHFYMFAANTLEATGFLAESMGDLGYKPIIQSVVICGSFNPAVSRYCVDFKVA